MTPPVLVKERLPDEGLKTWAPPNAGLLASNLPPPNMTAAVQAGIIVPEVNAGLLKKKDKIIANPNCSTIQMVMALYPLHKKYKIKRIVVSTYQSVTGTGIRAVEQLAQPIPLFAQPQAEGQVVANTEVRVEAVPLKDHGNVALR